MTNKPSTDHSYRTDLNKPAGEVLYSTILIPSLTAAPHLPVPMKISTPAKLYHANILSKQKRKIYPFAVNIY